MLKLIGEIEELTPAERLGAVIRGWVALDMESGAQLSQTHGRTKGGLPKYVLILPNKSVEGRGGHFEYADWDYPGGRKFIRAWTLKEASDIANQKLERMLREREGNGQNKASLATI